METIHSEGKQLTRGQHKEIEIETDVRSIVAVFI